MTALCKEMNMSAALSVRFADPIGALLASLVSMARRHRRHKRK